MKLIPKIEPGHACKKPCHDCPYRKDIAAYSSSEDVANNVSWIALAKPNDEGFIPVCHHSGGMPHREITTTGPVKVCAGFLTTLGPQHEVTKVMQFNVNHGIPCFEGIKDYASNALCENQTWEHRMRAWCSNQPRHVQEKWKRIYPDLFEREKEQQQNDGNNQSTLPQGVLDSIGHQ